MGVEPTRDRAERPLSRFEDGETHRGPYTSTRYSGIDLTDCQATRLKWVALLERPGIYIPQQTLTHLMMMDNSRLF